MSELSPRAKAMLQLVRDSEGPEPGAQERVERKVALRVAAGAALVAGSAVSKSATGASLVFLKTAAVVTVGAAVSVVGYRTLSSNTPVAPAVESSNSTSSSPAAARAQAVPRLLPQKLDSEEAVRASNVFDVEKPQGAVGQQGSVEKLAGEEQQGVVGQQGSVEKLAGEEQQGVVGQPSGDVQRGVVKNPGSEAAMRLPTQPHPPSRATEPLVTPGNSVAPSLPEVRSEPSPTERAHSTRSVGDLGAAPASEPVSGGAAAPLQRADALRDETLALRRIQLALRGGNGSLALQLLGESARQFSGGVLQQERAAARVQALCLSGQAASAGAAANAFVARWPRSPLRARVENACR